MKVISKTVSNYLTGTSWFLQNKYYVDTTFTKSHLVRNMMKGIMNLWRAQSGNKESDTRRLGVPLDLVVALSYAADSKIQTTTATSAPSSSFNSHSNFSRERVN